MFVKSDKEIKALVEGSPFEPGAGFSKALGQKDMQRHFTSRNMKRCLKLRIG